MSRQIHLAIIAAFALIAGPIQAPASQQVVTWNGGLGGWSESASWTPMLVPGNTPDMTYAVTIDGGKAVDSIVYFGGAYTASNFTIDSLTVDAGDVLRMPDDIFVDNSITALNGMTINGTASGNGGAYRVGPNETIGGSGMLELAGTSVQSTSGSLTIGSGLTVGGVGTVGTLGRPLVIRGNVECNAGGITYPLTIAGSTIENLGTLRVGSGGTIAIATDFKKIADLGTLVNDGGRFQIAGAMDNTGRTFALNNFTGDWAVSGTLHGGTLTTSDGAALHSVGDSAILDNVEVDGSLDIDSYSHLSLPAGQELSGTGTVSVTTLGSVSSASGPFTIGAKMTVRGGGAGNPGTLYGIGNATRPTMNHGHVIADHDVLVISGSSLTNTGTFEAANGILGFGGRFTRAGLGTLVSSGGAFRVIGTLDNTNQSLVIDANSVPWQVGSSYGDPAVITGGSIQTADGKALLVPDFTTADFDHVTINGTVQIGKPSSGYRATVRIDGPVNGNTEFDFSGPAFQSLVGIGALELGPDVFVHGTGGTVGTITDPLTNHGRIIADMPGRPIDVAGNGILNDGVLGASGSGTVLVLRGTYTRANLGTIRAASGGSIGIGGTMDNHGQTLNLPGTDRTWQLVRDGRIVGGTVTAAGIVHVGSGFGGTAQPTLDDVTFDGEIELDPLPAQLVIANGISGKCAITFPGYGTYGISAPGPLIFGPQVTIGHGANTHALFRVTIGDGSAPVINRGSIAATLPDDAITILGTTITNAGKMSFGGQFPVSSLGSASEPTQLASNSGTLHIGNKSELDCYGAMRFDDGGSLLLDLPSNAHLGSLHIFGDLDLSADDSLVLNLTDRGSDIGSPVVITYTGNLTGVFDHVTPGYGVDYSKVGLISIYVPEPDAGPLLLSAIAWAMALRRRHRT